MGYLPPLERLPFLKSLKIDFSCELEYIYYEEDFSVTFFPSLESLTLVSCYKLRGWQRMGDASSSNHLPLPSFPRLSELSIYGCHVLTRMPTFPNLDKRLVLSDCSVEALEATINIAASQCAPLSMLKSLHIGQSILDVKKIPKDWMCNLISLNYLSFEFLSIQTCQEIEIWFKDDYLNCLPSLQKMTLDYCDELKALPDWMCNLSALQHISMYGCRRLVSLPDGMPHLTNLQTLDIIRCPLLIEECLTQTSVNWPKIAHIPNLAQNCSRTKHNFKDVLLSVVRQVPISSFIC